MYQTVILLKRDIRIYWYILYIIILLELELYYYH